MPHPAFNRSLTIEDLNTLSTGAQVVDRFDVVWTFSERMRWTSPVGQEPGVPSFELHRLASPIRWNRTAPVAESAPEPAPLRTEPAIRVHRKGDHPSPRIPGRRARRCTAGTERACPAAGSPLLQRHHHLAVHPWRQGMTEQTCQEAHQHYVLWDNDTVTALHTAMNHAFIEDTEPPVTDADIDHVDTLVNRAANTPSVFFPVSTTDLQTLERVIGSACRVHDQQQLRRRLRFHRGRHCRRAPWRRARHLAVRGPPARADRRRP